MKKNMCQGRTGVCLTGLLLAVSLLSGCGSSFGEKYDTGYSTNGYAASYDTAAAATEEAAAADFYEYDMEDMEYEMKEEAFEQGSNAEILEENAQPAERKLIKTVDLSVETENYDALLGNIERQIAELGGYIEYQYQYNGSYYSDYNGTRSTNLEVRIPVERLDEFVGKVGEQTNVINKEERVEDVTLQYVDLESHKKALMTEQDRLMQLLEQAESVEDIIAIEQRLSAVRYELESMESQLRTLNNQINYSTINLYIQEVKRLTPTEEKSVWDKIRNGFVKTIYRIGDDIEEGFIWFVINIPYFVIWIAIIVIVILALRALIRRGKWKLGWITKWNIKNLKDMKKSKIGKDTKEKDEKNS